MRVPKIRLTERLTTPVRSLRDSNTGVVVKIFYVKLIVSIQDIVIRIYSIVLLLICYFKYVNY